MIVLSEMPEEQTASWLGILDLYEVLPEGWTLIGGQLVHLHCAERGLFPARPTNDADTVVDVLLPEGVGERARGRTGATGSPTLPTQGGTQALQRSKVVAVTVAGRHGSVRRPNLVGALIVKAAAHTKIGDQDPRRHRRDFLVLAGLIKAADFANEELSKKDRQRLLGILAAIERDRALLLEVPGSATAIARLKLAADLG